MPRFERVTWFCKPTFIGRLIYWSSSSSEVSMTASVQAKEEFYWMDFTVWWKIVLKTLS